LYQDFVKPPPDHIPARIRQDYGKMSCFADVRGAINGTYIDVFVPEHDQIPFRNRKGTLSQNVLLACTMDMNFFYVLAG
jgi:hypothetical protein